MFRRSAVGRISAAGSEANVRTAKNAVPPACPAVAYISDAIPIQIATTIVVPIDPAFCKS
jgi:hypothetical protein